MHTLPERLLAARSLFFAVVALALSGVGLYGVLNYAVVERRRELGIRIALGEGMGDVAGRLSLGAFAMIAAGVMIGLALGLVRFSPGPDRRALPRRVPGVVETIPSPAFPAPWPVAHPDALFRAAAI